MRRILLLLLVGCALAGSFFTVRSLYGRYQPTTPRILFMPKSTDQSIEFWRAMNEGVSTASKEYGIKVEVRGTAQEGDVQGQITLLKEAVESRPDAIVLAATDYNRIVPVAQDILAAGIKLITVDSGLAGNLGSSFVATDNLEAGIKAGDYLADCLGGKGTVAIISVVQGSATSIEREKGVRHSLDRLDDITVLSTYYSASSVEKAYEIVKQLLVEQPGLAGIAALNEPSTVGAARAIRDLGAADRVKLMGFDNSISEIAFLEEGILAATVIQKPFTIGYLGVEMALRTLRGEAVDAVIDTGSVVITKSNLYDSENQKLLFPFVGE